MILFSHEEGELTGMRDHDCFQRFVHVAIVEVLVLPNTHGERMRIGIFEEHGTTGER